MYKKSEFSETEKKEEFDKFIGIDFLNSVKFYFI